jgi:hypothetical protein
LKLRLFFRFLDRVGIGINMRILKEYYEQECSPPIPFNEVCGLNEIGTVIFIKDIPKKALVFNNSEPYNIMDFFNIHNTEDIINQTKNEFDILNQ